MVAIRLSLFLTLLPALYYLTTLSQAYAVMEAFDAAGNSLVDTLRLPLPPLIDHSLPTSQNALVPVWYQLSVVLPDQTLK